METTCALQPAETVTVTRRKNVMMGIPKRVTAALKFVSSKTAIDVRMEVLPQIIAGNCAEMANSTKKAHTERVVMTLIPLREMGAVLLALSKMDSNAQGTTTAQTVAYVLRSRVTSQQQLAKGKQQLLPRRPQRLGLQQQPWRRAFSPGQRTFRVSGQWRASSSC